MTQNSLQGLRQASVRAVTGTTLDYNGDWIALFIAAGIPGSRGFNGGMLEWINLKLGTSYTSLNAAMGAFAANQGVALFDWIGTFDATTSGASSYVPTYYFLGF